MVNQIYFHNNKTMNYVLANINYGSGLPLASEGEGEIYYNTADNTLYLNTGTAGTPSWGAIGSGGWVGAATSGLDMNGYAITEAAIAGTDSTSFTIDQDNTGAGATIALNFNRGATDGDARLIWDETNDRFVFEDDAGVTLAVVRMKQLNVSGQINLDDSTGTILIKEDDATGDMVLQVASGDAIVFKAV